MLSILVPSHNEKHIQSFVEEIEETFPEAHEIIIVNDREGKGKGWAIRQALLACKGDHIAFIDGDGDIPARMLWRLYPFIEDFDVVVGSKRMTNAPLQRKIITYLSRLYIRLMFGLSVETQTGIKLFRRTALNMFKTDGFFFDVELLVMAKREGKRMIEIPIESEITEPMSWRAIWKTFLDSLILIFR